METGLVFGLSIGDLLEIYDPDSQLWKMSGCLFTGDYAKSSGPLPKSGMMRSGRIYGQATWVRRTGGKESGLWPTPVLIYTRQDWTTEEIQKRQQEVKAETLAKGKHHTGNGFGLNLAQAAKMFPTPHSNCHTGAGKRGEGGENLQTAVMWPTPQSRDWKGKSQRGADPENRDCLPNAVMNFPTPRGTKVEGYSSQGFRPTLAQIVTGEDRPTGGQLNPTWVDWLMGYPIAWTDLEDSETQLSLKLPSYFLGR
jgi:DNA (cytosine-5)-methyltransferase 1